jgi:hypothetical protein
MSNEDIIKSLSEIDYSLNNIAGEMEGFGAHQDILKEYYEDVNENLSSISIELSNLNLNMERIVKALKAIADK